MTRARHRTRVRFHNRLRAALSLASLALALGCLVAGVAWATGFHP